MKTFTAILVAVALAIGVANGFPKGNNPSNSPPWGDVEPGPAELDGPPGPQSFGFTGPRNNGTGGEPEVFDNGFPGQNDFDSWPAGGPNLPPPFGEEPAP